MEVYQPYPRPYTGLPDIDLSLPRQTIVAPAVAASAWATTKSFLARSSPGRPSALKRSTTASGWSVLWIMIWGTSCRGVVSFLSYLPLVYGALKWGCGKARAKSPTALLAHICFRLLWARPGRETKPCAAQPEHSSWPETCAALMPRAVQRCPANLITTHSF